MAIIGISYRYKPATTEQLYNLHNMQIQFEDIKGGHQKDRQHIRQKKKKQKDKPRSTKQNTEI